MPNTWAQASHRCSNLTVRMFSHCCRMFLSNQRLRVSEPQSWRTRLAGGATRLYAQRAARCARMRFRCSRPCGKLLATQRASLTAALCKFADGAEALPKSQSERAQGLAQAEAEASA